ncbi:MAG: hypothetical protein WC477_07290 [Patescibacteria group bacterium]
MNRAFAGMLSIASVIAAATISSLTLSGKFVVHRTYVNTSSYSVLATDYYLAASSTSLAVTINLPAVTSTPAGRMLIIKDKNGSAATHNITISPYGGNTIDGATSFVLDKTTSSVSLINDAVGNWETLP